MTEPKHIYEAEALADAILEAAGSGLRHYSMAKTREAILTAAQQGLDAARAKPLDTLESIIRITRLRDANKARPEGLFDLLRDAEGTARGGIRATTGKEAA